MADASYPLSVCVSLSLSLYICIIVSSDFFVFFHIETGFLCSHLDYARWRRNECKYETRLFAPENTETNLNETQNRDQWPLGGFSSWETDTSTDVRRVILPFPPASSRSVHRCRTYFVSWTTLYTYVGLSFGVICVVENFVLGTINPSLGHALI